LTALVFGAGGLTGSALVSQLIVDDSFEKIIVFSRNAFPLVHPKIKSIEIDFQQLTTFKPEIMGDVLFCCLGTTKKKAGSKHNFEQVDLEYPTQLSQIASQNSVKKFVLISSMGANASSSNFYLNTKGKCEENVIKNFQGSVIIFRPGLLLGKRKELRVMEWIAQQIMKRINFLFKGKLQKYSAVVATHLATCMLEFSKNCKEQLRVVENDEITTFKS
jgi:uncharacterized protein YbjT (DUF2867 family)